MHALPVYLSQYLYVNLGTRVCSMLPRRKLFEVWSYLFKNWQRFSQFDKSYPVSVEKLSLSFYLSILVYHWPRWLSTNNCYKNCRAWVKERKCNALWHKKKHVYEWFIFLFFIFLNIRLTALWIFGRENHFNKGFMFPFLLIFD